MSAHALTAQKENQNYYPAQREWYCFQSKFGREVSHDPKRV